MRVFFLIFHIFLRIGCAPPCHSRRCRTASFTAFKKVHGKACGVNINIYIYTPVIKHCNGKSPFSIGNTSSKGSFSIAMLDYQRVYIYIYLLMVMIHDYNEYKRNTIEPDDRFELISFAFRLTKQRTQQLQSG